MNVSEYMRKYGLTDDDLNAMAAPYESGDYPSGVARSLLDPTSTRWASAA